MTCKNEIGQEIEIEVFGDLDDIQIDEAYYLDPTMPEEVCDEDIEWVMQHYAAEIEEHLQNKYICVAEYACEGER